jgi:hypothetical protein
VTLVTAANFSPPVATRCPDRRRVPPVLVDLGVAQHVHSIPEMRLLRLAQGNLVQVPKRTGETGMSRGSLGCLIEILPTAS